MGVLLQLLFTVNAASYLEQATIKRPDVVRGSSYIYVGGHGKNQVLATHMC
jgi:hypothetical protein